jgi:hypothetical protein
VLSVITATCGGPGRPDRRVEGRIRYHILITLRTYATPTMDSSSPPVAPFVAACVRKEQRRDCSAGVEQVAAWLFEGDVIDGDHSIAIAAMQEPA